MKAETIESEGLVFKFRGEILVDERQIEVFLKKIISPTKAAPPIPPGSATAPAMSDSLKGRLMFSVKETAEMLGIIQKTVYHLIQRNLLKTSKALRHIRIPKAEIERFLNSTAD